MLTHMAIQSVMLVLGISAVAAAQSVAPAPVAEQGNTAQPAGEAPAITLPPVHVGTPAPALKIGAWFKGTPVDRLEPGKLYVIEFWATWCGPCRQSIPHLTELAHKYREQVTVIGVSVFERPREKTAAGIAALVEPFVKQMGDQMDYTVAADDPNQTMGTTWMRAAAQNGIPCAFIVGKDGRIAWIGHPMQMDAVLEAVVAGTFDVQAEAARQIEEMKKEQELARLVEPIQKAMAAKDPNAIVKAVDAAVAARPELEEQVMAVKLNALLDVNEVSAFGYLKALGEKGFFDKDPSLAYRAVTVLVSRAGTMKKPNWAIPLDILEKASEARKNEDPVLLSAYAQILALAGQTEKAIEIQQKAIDLATPQVGTRFRQAWIDNLQKQLEEYKARKKR
jgi:thiol-disulfide isomerase/thioredoxin